uniref:Putative extracellular protein TR9_016 n=1 Tax=Trebouxia lynnae TaxID=1825957 RepID=A0A7L9QEN0_9CHLO|nr:putative extracellular protein TR9_016 [Trebouxia lynnae]
MLHCSARPRCAAFAALLSLALNICYAAAVRNVPVARRILQDSSLPTYQLVEYVGTSGATLTTGDIAKFPSPPDNVRLSWVVAFVGDATSDTTPSGTFRCTGGSFCSGADLDQDLITAVKAIGGSNANGQTQVYAGLGGANYPSWPDSSPDGYADKAAASLIAYAKNNNLVGYDLDFENGLNDDWVTQWTSIIFQLEKAGVIVTIDPFSGTKERYGQLYAALGKLGATGGFIGPEVSGVNYQAYAFDGNGSPSSEQDVMDDFSSGDSSVFNEFGVAKGQEIIFGVAPNRPGPESTPPVDSDCAGIERIKDLVCPALRDCTKGDLCADYTKSWAGGIMVFDFDTEFKLGKFTLVNTAYQALSGHCDDIQKC